MNANEQSNHDLPVKSQYGISMKNENHANDFVEDLFDEEGAFGEADCAGL
jgi:hypothetical protein